MVGREFRSDDEFPFGRGVPFGGRILLRRDEFPPEREVAFRYERLRFGRSILVFLIVFVGVIPV